MPPAQLQWLEVTPRYEGLSAMFDELYLKLFFTAVCSDAFHQQESLEIVIKGYERRNIAVGVLLVITKS